MSILTIVAVLLSLILSGHGYIKKGWIGSSHASCTILMRMIPKDHKTILLDQIKTTSLRIVGAM
jgi:hypothetical protein